MFEGLFLTADDIEKESDFFHIVVSLFLTVVL